MSVLSSQVHVTVAGALVALFIAVAVGSTLWWMLHPPVSYVPRIAAAADHELERLVGSVSVAGSPEIDSSHMVALAVKLARGERSELLAALCNRGTVHAAARCGNAARRAYCARCARRRRDDRK